jgi:hypothetical protein
VEHPAGAFCSEIITTQEFVDMSFANVDDLNQYVVQISRIVTNERNLFLLGDKIN